MAFIVADRVREVSASIGTGVFNLSGSPIGYQTFSASVGNGNTTYYVISNPGVNEWEVGIGTVGAGTLTRTTVLASSNGGTAVNFTAGSKDVFVTYPAEAAVFADNTVTLTNKTISGASNTLSNIGNSSLTNSSLTIGSTNIALGATSTSLADLTSVAATTFTGSLTGDVTGNVSGNAGTVTNGVYTVGDQTIGGIKTFSANPILNAGTANGVAYLNGSKVLTTGSALTFDGTNLGVGTNSPSDKLDVQGNISIGNGYGLYLHDSGGSTYSSITAPVANSLAFSLSGSEGMRLTGTGLGIGTSSPSSKLHVVGSIESEATTYNLLAFRTGTPNGLYLSTDASYNTVYDASGATAYGHIFKTGGTERMRIDSSGNVGIGTGSPSAFGKFVVAGSASVFANASVDGTLSDCVSFQMAAYGSTYQNIIRSSVSLDYRNSIYAFNISNGSGGSTTESMRIQGYRLMLKGSTIDVNDGSTGITFPATQNASSDANTLDDYEEGTWTPAIKFGGASTGITYSRQSGTYTKVGNVVTVVFDIRLTSKGTATGGLIIEGLPFASASGVSAGIATAQFYLYSGFVGLTKMGTAYTSGSTILSEPVDSLSVVIFNTNFTDSALFFSSFTYRAA